MDAMVGAEAAVLWPCIKNEESSHALRLAKGNRKSLSHCETVYLTYKSWTIDFFK